jgi:hypothetical protein
MVNENDNSDAEDLKRSFKVQNIFRALFFGVSQGTQGFIFFNLGRKYLHVAKEIPMMYEGTLSNMDISKKWTCISTLYVLLLVIGNSMN